MSGSLEWIIPYAEHFSYAGIFLALVLTSVGFPVPEDIILLTAGFISAQGYANLYIMIILTMVAILGGDLLMYALGYYFGESIFHAPFFRRIFTPARLAKIHGFYQNHGKKTVFIARFTPGLRAGAYILAGASKIGLFRFFLIDFLASLISVPVFVWLGYFLAPQIELVAETINRAKMSFLLIVVTAILAIILYRKFIIKKAKVDNVCQ